MNSFSGGNRQRQRKKYLLRMTYSDEASGSQTCPAFAQFYSWPDQGWRRSATWLRSNELYGFCLPSLHSPLGEVAYNNLKNIWENSTFKCKSRWKRERSWKNMTWKYGKVERSFLLRNPTGESSQWWINKSTGKFPKARKCYQLERVFTLGQP